MAKAFSMAMFKPNWAKWKINLADFFLERLPYLWIEKGNKIVKRHDHLSNQAFLRAVLADLDQGIDLIGTNHLPKTGPVTIVCNHPGGADVTATIMAISETRNDLVILANELICIPPIRDLVIPVRTMAKQKVDLSLVDAAYEEGKVVVFFAAGKNSRYNEQGELRDRRWRPTFLEYAKKYKTPINVLHISGANSPVFYKVSDFRKRHKRFKNIPLENIFQLRELMLPKGKTKLYLSKPIHINHELDETKAVLRQKADNFQSFLYAMNEDNLDYEAFMQRSV